MSNSDTEADECSNQNRYISMFLVNYLGAFRNFFTCKLAISIEGLQEFIDDEDPSLSELLLALESYGIVVKFVGSQESISEIKIVYENCDTHESYAFVYQLDHLTSLIRLSAQLGISLMAILLMKILSKIVCQNKIIFKALILDLDDTLWPGTIAEEGLDAIKRNLRSPCGKPFVNFMWFVRTIAQEYGLFVAICTRNHEQEINQAIAKLKLSEFPIKDQIDCVIANFADKSENIKRIAAEFSIMTNACIFIDDNQINRDSVAYSLPDVFVPQWSSHDELINIIEALGIFDRSELSVKSRNRKAILRTIKQDREVYLTPSYQVKIHQDPNHQEAMRLYRTAGQFKFNNNLIFSDPYESVYFEVFGYDGTSFGVAAALTFLKSDDQIDVVNFALSCRFFCIGLEEFILIYLSKIAASKNIVFDFVESQHNLQASAFINKYSDLFIENSDAKLKLVLNPNTLSKLQTSTKLREQENG